MRETVKGRVGEKIEIRSFRDLHVYQNSLEAAMEIFQMDDKRRDIEC